MSHHFNRRAHLNEQHGGWGLELRHSPELAYSVGFYKNSVRRTSRYAAIHWQPWSLGPVRLGMAAGLVDGYPRIWRGRAFPVASALASVEVGNIGLNLGYTPRVRTSSSVVYAQFKLRWP